LTGKTPWNVRWAEAARADLSDILIWTSEKFGTMQAKAYSSALYTAFDALVDGPATVGLKARPKIGEDVYSLHVARRGTKGRHFLLCRADRSTNLPTMVILRVLHDAMDLYRHVES